MKSRLLALPIAAALSVTSAAYGSTAGAAASGPGGSTVTMSRGGLYSPPPIPSPTGTTDGPWTDSPPPGVTPPPGGTPTSTPTTPSPSASPSLIGQRCSLPESGPGSAADLAEEPLGTAASHIPDLSDLVDAAKKAGLMDTLDSVENVTVFAPTNEAVRKMSDDERQRLTQNKDEMRKVVTYHVVEGRLTPDDLEKGDLTTLQGGKLDVTRSGDTFQVDGAQVVCGNIQTKNATIYLIDSVLKPGG